MKPSLKEKYKNLIAGLDKSVSTLFFRELVDHKNYRIQISRPFENTPLFGLPPTVQESFSKYNNIEQEEYFTEINGVHYIEPKNGWIFDKRLKKYYSFSFPYSYLEQKPSFLRVKLRKYKILKLDTVISIRYYFNNYWHFLNDVLGQIALMDEKKIPSSTPIVVPDGVLDITFIKQIIENSDNLKNRTWITHKPGILIESYHVLVGKNLPNTKVNFTGILKLLNIDTKKTFAKENRKIFLKRGKNRCRTLSNSYDIEQIAIRYGLEVIDTDSMTFQQQKSLFSNTSFVAGIHGAGLTNLIFRFPHPLQVFEIFPKNLIPPHYYWLSHQMGFSYSSIVGEEENDTSFFLDPILFENALRELT